MKYTFSLICCFLFGLTLFAQPETVDPKIDDILECTVLVKAVGGTGSGIVFKRGEAEFVWTDGHVVDGCEKIVRVIDTKTGQMKYHFTYSTVEVIREVYDFKTHRKIGEAKRTAEILRFSDAKTGEDLAMLRIKGSNFVSKGVVFNQDDKPPKIGAKLYHVGSMAGMEGYNTFSSGEFAYPNRLRRAFRPAENGNIYDQITLSCLPGSSGGGVFLQSDGSCVGLVTEGIRGSEAINCMTPSRRIKAFAKRTNCMWAFDSAVALPSEEEISKGGIRDGNYVVPESFSPSQDSLQIKSPPSIVIRPISN